jgi:Trypsin-like peptidase domain
VLIIPKFLIALLAISSQAMAGTIGADQRLAIADYARRHNMDVASARKLFGASGRIMCPFNAASAFLVHRSDIVLTARHAVIPEPSMHSYAGYARPSRCAFELSSDGITSTWYEVNVEAIVYQEGKQRSTTDRFDWIALKLVDPIPGVTPYMLPRELPAAREKVTLVTLRQEGFPREDWNERIVEDCSVRNIANIDGVPGSGLKTDCSATRGASGGALVRQGADGLEVIGVHSSVTGSCRKYSSRSCYSFAVGISEDVSKAIRVLAGEQ